MATSQDPMYKLRYKDMAVEFEVEGDKPFVEEQAKRFFDDRLPVMGTVGRPRVGGRGPRGARGVSPVEQEEMQGTFMEMAKNLQAYLREARPSGGPDIALAAAYHLTHDGGRREFATRDLTRLVDLVKNVTVGNMSLAVRRAVERGFMIEHKRPEGGRSTYSISDRGSSRVENGFA